MREFFTTFDICKVFDLPFERFRSWLKLGFVIPQVKAKGRGTKNYFTIGEVYQIGIFKTLIDAGFQRKAAAQIASYINLWRIQKHGKNSKNISTRSDYISILFKVDALINKINQEIMDSEL